mmetsp:Transcript_144115/g.401528  ORF Transcript_144115/g.401528 Transcript_144115/m.401528 type:complete len:248 (-) Transcript_144115:48-791(-)
MLVPGSPRPPSATKPRRPRGRSHPRTTRPSRPRPFAAGRSPRPPRTSLRRSPRRRRHPLIGPPTSRPPRPSRSTPRSPRTAAGWPPPQLRGRRRRPPRLLRPRAWRRGGSPRGMHRRPAPALVEGATRQRQHRRRPRRRSEVSRGSVAAHESRWSCARSTMLGTGLVSERRARARRRQPGTGHQRQRGVPVKVRGRRGAPRVASGRGSAVRDAVREGLASWSWHRRPGQFRGDCIIGMEIRQRCGDQ